jgi:hypothetical protein
MKKTIKNFFKETDPALFLWLLIPGIALAIVAQITLTVVNPFV